VGLGYGLQKEWLTINWVRINQDLRIPSLDGAKSGEPLPR
jgi:hypothetical protein